MKITRYSPGSFGAMTEDVDGKYVRIEDAAKLAHEYRNQGIMAGSFLADENAEELRKAQELLRYTVELLNENVKAIGVCECLVAESLCIYCRMVSLVKHIEDHWRPIGPMPEVKR